MKNNSRIISLAFVILSVILVVFFVWPIFKEIKRNSQDLISAKNKIVVLEAQNFQTDNFRKVYQLYKPDLDRISQLYIDPGNPVDFIKFLEDTASDFKITSKISLQASKKNSQNFIIFQLSSDGNFTDVLNFTKKIESGPYLLEIENLTIQNAQDSEKTSATFAIKAFINK